MNERLEIVYRENLKCLYAMIGMKIESALRELYFYENKLDEESLGTLKLKLSNNHEFIFNCDVDAESLIIEKGGFSNKGTLTTDFEDNRYRWDVKEFISHEKLLELGRINKCYIEWLTSVSGTIQSGCRIDFANGEYLQVWTIESDNIFYELNQVPPYYNNKNLKIELIEIGLQ